MLSLLQFSLCHRSAVNWASRWTHTNTRQDYTHFVQQKVKCVRVCLRWTTQTIPLVNPAAEALELLVANSNPRNYTVEMDPGSTVSTHTHILVCAFCHDIQLIWPCSCF